MSPTVHVPSETPRSAEPAGWIVFDPTGRPYAWCGSDFADDAAAAMAFLVPDPAERQGMVEAGWSISPGRATEFVCGGRGLARASA